MGTTQHQLTDHGVAAALLPGACAITGIAVCGRGVSRLQPVLIAGAAAGHITDGVDAVCAAQVLSCHIGPDDGGDQGIAILGDAELAEIRVQIVLDCLVTGAQILQHGRKERRIRRDSFSFCNIGLIPCTKVTTQNDLSQEILNGFAATSFIPNNTRIGSCAAAGVVVVEPIVGKAGPGKGAAITCQVLRREVIHIGVRIPTSLYDKGVIRNGEGIKYRCRSFALILTGTVPGDGLASLDSIDHIAMGVVSVITLIIAIVDDLHGDADSNHITGAIAGRVTAAIATATNLRTGAAAVITCRTSSEHRRSSVRLSRCGSLLLGFFLTSCFLNNRLRSLGGRFCGRFGRRLGFFCRRLC